ncbi:hypothetical protein VCRA2121O337_180048 [Vibrio crassostreae]|nr:hypothetical protein VCRA2120E331_170047 [Vibrio crassostreae]CAK3248841.1 hypothetical protein VCRA2127O345_170055 [Vibrio crassostreae]CAK3272289.1 hypothetical protein VCRA2120E330_180049 [Vibrio crassostreae]CAK3285588.1 hypothetical protein VCRA2122O338_170048 [Vibrio crassostreae]CAK3353420.1 hypothetical protein VCRA2122O340_170054 [Vibrio crassostreae]
MIDYPLVIAINRPKNNIDSLNVRDAKFKIEAYVNEHCFNEINTFTYALIAKLTGISQSKVKDLLMPIEGGATGITVRKCS